jgi:hypothetical protein
MLHNLSTRKRRLGIRQSALRLEQLEKRYCLACDAMVSGNTLRIIGDDLNNTALITDDGAGTVIADCDGDPAAGTRIEKIEVHLRGGDDRVNYNLTGNRVRKMELKFDLGRGNDSATLDFMGPTTIAADFQIDIRQGDGIDALSVFAIGTTLEANAQLEVKVDGGRGNDSSFLDFFASTIRKDLKIDVKQGDGIDDFVLFAEFSVIAANGKLEAKVDDGNGSDVTAFVLFGAVVEKDLVIEAKQGDGNDHFRVFGEGMQVGANGKLEVKLDAGRGDDDARLLFDGAVIQKDVQIDLKQGEGVDEFEVSALDMLLESGALFELKWDGDKGDDIAEAELGVRAGSTGKLKAEIKGGDDDDDLTLLVFDASGGLADIDAILDGGNGFDICVSTPNVEEKDCEA